MMMKNWKQALLAGAVMAVLAGELYAGSAARVLSPDGAVALKLWNESGRLRFAVTFKDQPVIESSPLSFTLDGIDLAEGAELGTAKSFEVKETYPWRGVHSQAINHCHGLSIPVTH